MKGSYRKGQTVRVFSLSCRSEDENGYSWCELIGGGWIAQSYRNTFYIDWND